MVQPEVNGNKISSPLTGSSDISLLETIPVKQLIEAWKQVLGFDITQEFAGLDNIQMHCCNQTGLVFFSPREVAGSAHLYEQLQMQEWYYSQDKWEHKTALERLSSSKKILEIGCGSGLFVKLAQNVGLNVEGIEINPSAVQEAKNQGLPVELIDLEDAVDLYGSSFDAVCSFQVLEHVTNPGNFIHSSLALLKPGGKMIICVPNAESFIKLYHEPLDFPPHHMSKWKQSTFKALEKHFPIKLEKCISEPLTNLHFDRYLSAVKNKIGLKPLLAKVVFNRLFLRIYRRLLRSGASQFLSGQCLYVEFRKI